MALNCNIWLILGAKPKNQASSTSCNTELNSDAQLLSHKLEPRCNPGGWPATLCSPPQWWPIRFRRPRLYVSFASKDGLCCCDWTVSCRDRPAATVDCQSSLEGIFSCCCPSWLPCGCFLWMPSFSLYLTCCHLGPQHSLAPSASRTYAWSGPFGVSFWLTRSPLAS